MRRISRLGRSIDPLRIRSATQVPSGYLCFACQRQSISFSISVTRRSRSNAKVPFTEKVRQRIWGTDHPPGLEDPYGDASAFDQTKKRAAETEFKERKALATAAPDLGSYEPATTWDGLERVGGFGNWWKENWDPDHQFKGFLPAEVVTNTAEVTAALHRATVEVFGLQQAGKPLHEVSNAAPSFDLTTEVHITPSETGATLRFQGDATLEKIVQSLYHVTKEAADRIAPARLEEAVAGDVSAQDIAVDISTEDAVSEMAPQVTYDDVVSSWDPAWLQISLENPEIKFAVLKRTMQLTGVRIPDSVIKSAKTTQALLTHLVTPPNPRKLVDALAQKENLMALPNVSVYAKRVTPIDQERSVGRWKIIEKELQDRGLPVTGH